MRKHRSIVLLTLLIVLTLQAATFRSAVAPQQQRAIEIDDIMAWKGINATSLSENGEWFGYRLAPVEGESEIVLRQTRGDKEYKFKIGEAPAPTLNSGPPNPAELQPAGAAMAFSSDGKFAAFTIYPTAAEAAQARRQRQQPQNKVGVVNLETGEKREIAKVRRYVFSGENPGWLALHKYGANAAPQAETPAGGQGQRGGSAPARDDRPRGADLLLCELATDQEIVIGNVGDFAFDKKGQYLAWTIDAQDKTGNGVTLRTMDTGVIRSVESDSTAVYSRLAWNEDGEGLAVLKGVDNKDFEDKQYSVIAFKDFAASGPQKFVFNPAESNDFPADMTVSPNRTPLWTKDLSAVLFGIHKSKKKETAARTNEDGTDDRVNLVIWHWQDKRLPTQQAVQENQDRNFSYLASYRPAEKKFIRYADDEVRDVTPSPEHKFAMGRNDDPYEMMGNIDGRRFADVWAIDMQSGERKLAVKQSRWTYSPSPAGTQFVYYNDGHFYTYDLATGSSRNVTSNVPASFINTEDDHNVVKPPTAFIGWSSDSKSILLSDNWDIWQVPVAGGTATNLTVDGRKQQIRYRRPAILDPDQRGFDLTKPLYLDVYGEWTKENGIGVIDPGRPGVRRITWEKASYGPVIKARKADVYLYTRQTEKDPPDYFVTDTSITNGKRITNLAAGQEQFLWTSGTILVNYVSEKGDKLQGALHLPANYEKGRQYPTLVYFYEKMSQTAYQYSRPSANGSNTSVYTSHGYAVYNPDITYKVNDPGMSAVWSMVPAVKAAIATGVVDPKRIGIHGHSWGGYQTSFLITQTDIFAAAVAGAPLTDMISMYPIIYKNTGGTNGAIFESSQGRFTSGPWENWEAYTRNSPVAFVPRVKTPLLMLHNDRDGAVDFTQGVEFFNSLRRLQKPVVLLEYPGENHNLVRRPNQKDYTIRMKEFFDHYLKGAPAPDWWRTGVPRLEMEEHIKQRQPAKKTSGEK